jgi:hypothetical protein
LKYTINEDDRKDLEIRGWEVKIGMKMTKAFETFIYGFILSRIRGVTIRLGVDLMKWIY